MKIINSWIVSPFKKLFDKRFGPTSDELEELKEIEKIAHEVCDTFNNCI